MTAPEIPDRLLLGPGPSNAHPRVLAAMSQPLLGHMDPAFLEIMEDVKARLRRCFGTSHEMTLPLSATGSAGMEACFVNLLESGDHVVIGVAGVFGERMCEVAHRAGANVHRVDAEWGKPLPEDEMIEAIQQHGPRVVAFVHAETSTGVCQPVEAIAQAARDAGAFVLLDCVTSLGGMPLAIDDWGVDAVYSGTQKCLSCPPGLSPVSFSPRAVEHVAARRTPVQSWYLDVSLLAGYYGKQRVYHHTAPISAIYALAEGLRIVEEEGIGARERRHREASAHLLEGLSHLGFEPLVDAAYRLPQLNTVRLPARLIEDGEADMRGRLLQNYGIEVGGGLGALAGKIWRVGLMGENARNDRVDRLLHALQDELA